METIKTEMLDITRLMSKFLDKGWKFRYNLRNTNLNIEKYNFKVCKPSILVEYVGINKINVGNSKVGESKFFLGILFYFSNLYASVDGR